VAAWSGGTASGFQLLNENPLIVSVLAQPGRPTGKASAWPAESTPHGAPQGVGFPVAAEPLWNAFHNGSVAPKTPFTLIEGAGSRDPRRPAGSAPLLEHGSASRAAKDRIGRAPGGRLNLRRKRKKWGVISNDLNNAEALFTTGPARADRLGRAVSPAPVAVVRITP
jgi:hypothetical protein